MPLHASALSQKPNDDRILYAGLMRQERLNVLGVDIRAVGQDDEVLLSPFQEQVALLVQLAQVPRFVPAVRQGGARRLLVAPVAWGHVRAAHLDLAVLGDADLDAGYGLAHRAGRVVPEGRGRDDRRGFRRPTSLEHLDAHCPPGLRQRWVEVSAAAAEE